MMGLAEIKLANRNPKKHAQSQLSDGQERRNNSPPNAFWSERPVGADHSEPYHHRSENLAEMQIAPRLVKHLDDDYFAAVALSITLDKKIKRLTDLQAELVVALKLANINSDNSALRAAFIVISAEDANIAIEAHVDMLARQIDVAAPEPRGYTPHMGIQYALAPIKATIQKMRAAFKHA